MSIIRFINGSNREAAQLGGVIQYVTREGSLPESCMAGQGITPAAAYADMLAAKKMFHQEDGKQYLHFVVSYDQVMRQVDVVRQIGIEMAKFYEDYQVLITTHTDTENLHCHLIINSVNMKTGKKISQRRKDFLDFIQFANEVFEHNNLPRIGMEQVYEIFQEQDSEDYYWDADLDEFDEAITNDLEVLNNKYGVQRPIFWYDSDKERVDKLRAIDRMKQFEMSRRENGND